MLKLSGKTLESQRAEIPGGVYLLSTDPSLPEVLRKNRIFIIRDENIPDKFAHYFISESLKKALPKDLAATKLAADFDYLGNNDIVKISDDFTHIAVMYRASSKHNSFLVTEQCNHYCLMCSQPPKKIDDSYLLDDIEKAIPLVPKDTLEIGFTGGEPTLNGDRFLNILKLTKSYLPNTSVHILSNGRSFSDFNFAKKYASICHHDMMVGIPIYSDDPQLHDYIVQAEGAFDETILGILNLKRLKQKVEIRVVLHKQSIPRLVELCQFISRNLLFVDHVALMGLEMMGFARANIDDLWIDQSEYKDKLSEAVGILSKSRMNVSIYNHQLCLINEDTLPFYRKSISEWKNEYADECLSCIKRDDCGGFFSSGIKYKYSPNLKPFLI
jgi:His-Xaa-Ser system radical SAM maturase HxsC